MNLKAQQRWPPTALPFFKRLNVLSTRQSGVWVMTSKECFTCSRPLKAQRLCSLGDEGHNTRKRSVGVGWSSFTVPRSTIKLHVWWHHCLHMLCFNRSYLLQVPDPARAEWVNVALYVSTHSLQVGRTEVASHHLEQRIMHVCSFNTLAGLNVLGIRVNSGKSVVWGNRARIVCCVSLPGQHFSLLASTRALVTGTLYVRGRKKGRTSCCNLNFEITSNKFWSVAREHEVPAPQQLVHWLSALPHYGGCVQPALCPVTRYSIGAAPSFKWEVCSQLSALWQGSSIGAVPSFKWEGHRCVRSSIQKSSGTKACTVTALSLSVKQQHLREHEYVRHIYIGKEYLML